MIFSKQLKLQALRLIKAASLPKIQPELATLAKEIPTENNWIFEPKFDGYRAILIIEDGDIKIYSRNQKDWTDKFPPILKDASNLNIENVMLDGEIAIQKGNQFDFQALQNSTGEAEVENLFYYVFDILYLNDEDLRDLPLQNRKEILENLIKNSTTTKIKYVGYKKGNGETYFNNACDMGQEGIMAKKLNSLYIGKRTKDWLKIKCTKRQEFVIGGYIPVDSEDKEGVGALLVGVYEGKKLDYCGKVGSGFNNAKRIELLSLLEPQRLERCPFNEEVKEKNAIWVRPTLVAEISFFEWTDEGKLRHPVFKGLREDKNPKEVKREIEK